MPDASTPSNTGIDSMTATTTTTAPSPQAAANSASCVVNDDYKWLVSDHSAPGVKYDTKFRPLNDPAGGTFNANTDMFFKPDSTDEFTYYNQPNPDLSAYDNLAQFYKNTSSKQWKFRLEGSTFGSDAAAASSLKLANARADKVKAALLSRGVPADRIVIDPPHDYSHEDQNFDNDIYRRVEIVVDPTCNTGAASTNGR